MPGIAWDGYGRTLLVAAPVKIPVSKFANFQADTPAQGLLIKVWLRYDEGTTGGPAAGFEACTAGSQYSRAIETYAIEVGEPPQGPHGPVSVAGFSIDARTARSRFVPTAPPLYDESVPYQALPVGGSKPQWWIPVGYVRWLKLPGQPGVIIARDDSGSGGQIPDSDLIRGFRQYIGVVAETILAADGALRLRRRDADPTKAHFQPPRITVDPKNPPENDLVWIEGSARVFGDARLAGGLLEWRNDDGLRDAVPQVARRLKNPEGGLDLQVAYASTVAPAGANAFAVGIIDVDATSGQLKTLQKQLVVRDNGNVGVGIDVPPQLLTLAGDGQTRLEIGKVSASFPWSSNTAQNDGAFAINQQSKGSSHPGADFALKRDGKLRVTLGDASTFVSGQGGAVVIMLNQGEPGEAEAMRVDVTGNVGLGAAGPVAKLDLAGDFALEKIGNGGPRALPAGATLVWNDGTWLRLNQNLDYSKPIFGVHTPGVLAPLSLNVGGVNAWGDPGGGNMWVGGDATINGAAIFNGTLSVAGATSLKGLLTATGGTALTGNLLVDNAVVTGNFAVWGFKSFVTEHPNSPDHVLAHVSIEGPEAAVFYRGTGQLKQGAATIRLPSYFTGLTRAGSCTVQLTPVFSGKEDLVALAASEVVNGRFKVRAIGTGNPSQRFYWEVKAARADVPEFVAEQPVTPEVQRVLDARRGKRG